ncbi:adenylate cyclase 9 [Paragonimus westermani]|uniref:adenylate cyclase n=1 Tax=Paragonimus westermani TaxID=34504 RepID=A0A5J4NRP7_9TREM|nr:adenylate cyclase 9 [Paragonimus westermani]
MKEDRFTSVSEHSRLHGYRLTELFDSGRSGLPVLRQFIRSICEATQLVQFDSHLLENYYNSILLSRTKTHFRSMMRYLFYIIFITVLEVGTRNPQTTPICVVRIGAFCAPILLAYVSTLSNPNHQVYVKLSFVLCLTTAVLIIWARVMIFRQEHGLYSPDIVLVIGIFALLPLRTTICVCISVMHLTVTIGLEVYHSSVKDIPLKHSWLNIDAFRRLQHSNRTHALSRPLKIVAIQTLAWLPILLTALYVRFWNIVRRCFTFFKLGKSVQARNECKSALKGQVRWIEAIMPSVIRIEYQALRQKNIDVSSSMWVFNRTYDNVSILFADIVGFTRMSSNKTAHRVVTMLNNLFNRFDELCQTTKCEKIGTLGDCYYCVSGCPIAQPNHAVCCVEMGLGMCRIIKAFNRDFDESVGMRIGVHTGRVNAAIIGSQRFRFDVYSYDVIIASALESTGRAGRVHISENTFELVKNIYNCSRGEPLQIRKEQVRGIAGMELVNTYISSYFVDPRSSLWRTKHERYGQAQTELYSEMDQHSPAHRRSMSFSENETSSTEVSMGDEQVNRSSLNTREIPWRLTRNEPETLTGVIHSFERDMQLIDSLQTDSEKQCTLFQDLPLSPTTLAFRDPESEWHYYSQVRDPTKKIYMDSRKVSPLVDVSVCLAVLLISFLNCFLLASYHESVSTEYVIMSVVAVTIDVIICGLVSFAATNYDHHIGNARKRVLHRILIHPLINELCMAIITIMPSLMLSSFLKYTMNEELLLAKRQILSIVAFHCVLIHVLPLSSFFWARISCAIISLLIITLSGNCVTRLRCPNPLCSSLVPTRHGFTYVSFCYVLRVELIACLVLVGLVTRENERNCRLCFYVSREAEICGDQSEQAVNEAQEMLYNIIPKYVMDHLKLRTHDDVSGQKSFNYAVSIPNAGVAFATISNFFSNYYREDYKGGENALKLLNSIVCIFDSFLGRPDMKDVEKIKTINDCYMVAAGLNRDEVTRNRSNILHLVALMNYCHMIIEALNEFNDMYIIGTDKFEIKVGYNAGPLIAGIIGNTKPMYDIWGNTVNVASRMYSTGIVGKIQVPQDVADELQGHFRFVYRGEIFVKGKGDMKTYLCEKNR